MTIRERTCILRAMSTDYYSPTKVNLLEEALQRVDNFPDLVRVTNEISRRAHAKAADEAKWAKIRRWGTKVSCEGLYVYGCDTYVRVYTPVELYGQAGVNMLNKRYGKYTEYVTPQLQLPAPSKLSHPPVLTMVPPEPPAKPILCKTCDPKWTKGGIDWHDLCPSCYKKLVR